MEMDGKLFLYHSFMTIMMEHQWFVSNLVTLEALCIQMEVVVTYPKFPRDGCAQQQVKTFLNVRIKLKEQQMMLELTVLAAQELLNNVTKERQFGVILTSMGTNGNIVT